MRGSWATLRVVEKSSITLTQREAGLAWTLLEVNGIWCTIQQKARLGGSPPRGSCGSARSSCSRSGRASASAARTWTVTSCLPVRPPSCAGTCCGTTAEITRPGVSHTVWESMLLAIAHRTEGLEWSTHCDLYGKK